jgi:hypothetical protein
MIVLQAWDADAGVTAIYAESHASALACEDIPSPWVTMVDLRQADGADHWAPRLPPIYAVSAGLAYNLVVLGPRWEALDARAAALQRDGEALRDGLDTVPDAERAHASDLVSFLFASGAKPSGTCAAGSDPLVQAVCADLEPLSLPTDPFTGMTWPTDIWIYNRIPLSVRVALVNELVARAPRLDFAVVVSRGERARWQREISLETTESCRP